MTNLAPLEVIANVAIAETGELLLKLESGGDPTYQYVYRAGAGVYWEPSFGGFKTTQQRGWPYAKWFAHTVEVVQAELGLKLVLGKHTTWTNVSPAIQDELLHAVT